MSDSMKPPGRRPRPRSRLLLLGALSFVVALGLAIVAQRQAGQGHVVRTSLAIGGALVVLGWATDSIAGGVTRLIRGRRGTSG